MVPVPPLTGREFCRIGPSRRTMLAGLLAAAAVGPARRALAGDRAIRFGITPVFLSNDLDLLARLGAYLERATGTAVELVMRRTYQEITALLVSAQLDAAWICGYPFIRYRSQLNLIAVPVWRGETLYRSYLIVPVNRTAANLAQLRGDIHAFSDPDSNSGFLVTAALLAENGLEPETFFRKAIFTYGHRNVVRAVASGLAHSGSVDGYVLEVLREVEPALAGRVAVIHKSEWLGFPPVAAPHGAGERTEIIRRALLAMSRDEEGRAVLASLQLDGFEERPPALYDPIARMLAALAGAG